MFNKIQNKILREVKLNQTFRINEKGIVRKGKIIIPKSDLDKLSELEMNEIKNIIKRINDGKVVFV